MKFYRRWFDKTEPEEITEYEARNKLAPHADNETWKEVIGSGRDRAWPGKN